MIAVSIVLPAVLLVVAVVLARREWRQYRVAAEIGSDLFVYSRGRLVRRMIGVGMLVALAVTLVLFGILPPRSPRAAGVWLAVILGEVLALVVLPIFDLWETARTARPGRGLRAKD